MELYNIIRCKQKNITGKCGCICNLCHSMASSTTGFSECQGGYLKMIYSEPGRKPVK